MGRVGHPRKQGLCALQTTPGKNVLLQVLDLVELNEFIDLANRDVSPVRTAPIPFPT